MSPVDVISPESQIYNTDVETYIPIFTYNMGLHVSVWVSTCLFTLHRRVSSLKRFQVSWTIKKKSDD